MTVKVNKEAIEVIEEILRRGKDAVVYRNKDGVVVAEQSRTIKYRAVRREEQ